MNMKQQLIDYVSREFLSSEADGKISADDDLLTSGLVDSLGVMRLVGFIESELGSSVSPQDVTIENFGSVSAIVSYLESRKTTA